MEEEKVRKEQMEIAQMRFGMIAPVIQGTYPDASVCAYCRRVAQKVQSLPDDGCADDWSTAGKDGDRYGGDPCGGE